MRSDRQRRHALHEAGCQAPKAAIAKGCVVLDLAQGIELDIEAGQGGAHLFGNAEIVEGVRQKPADEKFKREVIDVPLVLRVAGFPFRNPAVHDAVAGGERCCQEPIARVCGARVLPNRVGKAPENGLAQLGNRLRAGFCLARFCDRQPFPSGLRGFGVQRSRLL